MVCPCCAVDGSNETLAGGSIVRLEVFVLAKVAPPCTEPVMLAVYTVGARRVRAAGTVKVTFAVVPTTRANPDAVTWALGPVPGVAGASETVILLARIVPDGTLVTVSRTAWTPGCATAGNAEDESVTGVCACIDAAAAIKRKMLKQRETADVRLFWMVVPAVRMRVAIKFNMCAASAENPLQCRNGVECLAPASCGPSNAATRLVDRARLRGLCGMGSEFSEEAIALLAGFTRVAKRPIIVTNIVVPSRVLGPNA